MAEMEYSGYRIVANVRQGEGAHAGEWIFDAASIYDAQGNQMDLAAPVAAEVQYFESEEAAAKVCLSQAKALIVAGDVG